MRREQDPFDRLIGLVVGWLIVGCLIGYAIAIHVLLNP